MIRNTRQNLVKSWFCARQSIITDQIHTKYAPEISSRRFRVQLHKSCVCCAVCCVCYVDTTSWFLMICIYFRVTRHAHTHTHTFCAPWTRLPSVTARPKSGSWTKMHVSMSLKLRYVVFRLLRHRHYHVACSTALSQYIVCLSIYPIRMCLYVYTLTDCSGILSLTSQELS